MDVSLEELRFVSGKTKTNKWACAAISGPYKHKRGTAHVDMGSGPAPKLSISIAGMQLPNVWTNSGPVLGLLSRVDSPAATGPQERNQCIFINYFAVKKRLFFPRVVRAAAGPHELPPGAPGPGEQGPSAVPARRKNTGDSAGRSQHPSAPGSPSYDPVGQLLEYILERSDADMAIASDVDLIAIFGTSVIPEDILTGLVHRQPSIEVDEHGVGTISMDLDMGSPEQPFVSNTAASVVMEEIVSDPCHPPTPTELHTNAERNASASSRALRLRYGDWTEAEGDHRVVSTLHAWQKFLCEPGLPNNHAASVLHRLNRFPDRHACARPAFENQIVDGGSARVLVE
ncbi:hypothetical protein DICSQDRAFT_171262 [Dichomitus squalens LYAD-421 SS1]|uniref:Uncharacterized protein n=1 Tax=Dichomitus squalens (strain LYAD-421) TaxID=732165 RepID=R7SZB2_DICSQ|nr:uncharacterized protein DICSQDRAFT_171262 [Dichomitus squalens LYAD-421 SS1]EJF60302.1 hypothetical protein DICSQDRAFT_171262 [Dichomitus squalens LYAD-421 SS1]